MFDSLLSTNIISIADWQLWGVIVAFAVTSVTTCWVFFDSQRNQVSATFWRLITLVAALIVTPSATLRLFPYLQAGFSSQILQWLALGGAVATVISFLSLILYAVGLGVRSSAAPSQLQEMDPEPVEANEADPAPSPAITGPQPLVEPTLQIALEPEVEPEPTPESLAWLVITAGPRAGDTYRLGEMTDIGREPCCNDIVIDDPALSRQHARIRYEDGVFVIYDLASANGTLLNNQPVQRAELHNGDRLQLGQTHFAFMQVVNSPDTQDAQDEQTSQASESVLLTVV